MQEQELVDLVSKGELEALIGNHKLSRFLEDVIVNRKTFDYVELKLFERE